jgi:hypothetical protein
LGIPKFPNSLDIENNWSFQHLGIPKFPNSLHVENNWNFQTFPTQSRSLNLILNSEFQFFRIFSDIFRKFSKICIFWDISICVLEINFN